MSHFLEFDLRSQVSRSLGKSIAFFSVLLFWVVSPCASIIVGQEKPQTVDPSGTWRWEYELGGETMKDFVRINLGKDNAVTGTYHGRSDKPASIVDGKLTADTLSFHFNVDIQGNSIKLDFKGKVKDDSIDGNVSAATSEGSREFPWAPKRSVQLDDTVGIWELKIETGDSVLEPKIEITKVGDRFKGRYVSGQQLDLAATNLKVENNHLTFSIAGEANGTKIKGDYKGRPYGDKIKGTIKYELGDQSGEIEFTGKRKASAK